MRWYPWLLLLICVLGSRPVHGQTVTDPVADLFTPRPPPPRGMPEQPVGPLRLPQHAPASPAPGGRPVHRPPPRPPFEFRPGERVVWLGDALFEAEAEHGYLETRIQAQYPDRRLTFRNLSTSPHNRLRDPDPRPAEASAEWLTHLLAEVRASGPGVVLLSYGTAAAWWGDEARPAFSNVYARVLDGVLAIDPENRPRIVMMSPLSYEPPPGDGLAEVTNRNAQALHFADTAWQISTNRGVEFVDFFLFSQRDVMASFANGKEGRPSGPRLTEDSVRPTAYGLRRLAFALERGLRWPSTNWRFGLMGDGQWREGGFGAQIHSHSRQDDHVVVVFTEERLPLPSPLPDFDLTAEDEPHRYIQLPRLNEGRYVLRVDGEPILRSTHLDWARYEIIARGPSWEQAERLRQAVVRKNARLARLTSPSADASPDVITTDPELAELEAAIAELKRPVPRRYEVVRTGDLPPEQVIPVAR